MSRHIEEVERLSREIARPMRYTPKLEPIAKRFVKRTAAAQMKTFDAILKVLGIPDPNLQKEKKEFDYIPCDEDIPYAKHLYECHHGGVHDHAPITKQILITEIGTINTEFAGLFGFNISQEIEKLTQDLIKDIMGDDKPVWNKGIWGPEMFDVMTTAGDASLKKLGIEFAKLPAYEKNKPGRPRQIPSKYVFHPNRELSKDIFNNGYKLVTSNITEKFLPTIKKVINDSMLRAQPMSYNSIARLLKDKVAKENLMNGLNAKAGTGSLWHWQRVVRTEMMSATDRTVKEEYAENGANYVKYSAAPGACPICTNFASTNRGYYALASSPSITDDTHPNCRCLSLPMYRLPKGITV